jgi:hypothetical protein
MKRDFSEIDLSGEDMSGITKKLTGEEKILLVCKVSDILKEKLEAYIRNIHPEWEDIQIQREMMRAFHGEEIASQVFDKNAEPGN